MKKMMEKFIRLGSGTLNEYSNAMFVKLLTDDSVKIPDLSSYRQIMLDKQGVSDWLSNNDIEFPSQVHVPLMKELVEVDGYKLLWDYLYNFSFQNKDSDISRLPYFPDDLDLNQIVRAYLVIMIFKRYDIVDNDIIRQENLLLDRIRNYNITDDCYKRMIIIYILDNLTGYVDPDYFKTYYLMFLFYIEPDFVLEYYSNFMVGFWSLVLPENYKLAVITKINAESKRPESSERPNDK